MTQPTLSPRALEAHANARVILAAAHRNRGGGARTWFPRGGMRSRVIVSAPRRHHLGWWCLTWSNDSGQQSLNIRAHRDHVKEVARQLAALAVPERIRERWRNAYRAARRDKLTGRDLFGAICAAVGAAGAWNDARGFEALRVQACLERIVTPGEPERYKRTRDVLNQFGRLNVWNRSTFGAAATRDSQRVRELRQRLLARQLIAPEPGGYVTGLLSTAPARMWWEGYPRPVQPLSAADVAIYEGRVAA